jgi:hypothetical protein
MKPARTPTAPLTVKLVGEIDHPDFVDAVQRIRADARVAEDNDAPELTVIAQSRPGAFSESFVRDLRRTAPLAGIVGLVGSWCEGETRTGRPWPDVMRVFWYQFPAWWYMQLRLRAAGLCPDWARPNNFGLTATSSVESRISDRRFDRMAIRNQNKASFGVVALRTRRRDTADALAIVLRKAGYSTAWQRGPSTNVTLRGVLAGIWDGGQLDGREAEDLSGFCRALARDSAPVVALLDYPRRDCCDCAVRVGAATVLGKPWRNDELLASIEMAVEQIQLKRAA